MNTTTNKEEKAYFSELNDEIERLRFDLVAQEDYFNSKIDFLNKRIDLIFEVDPDDDYEPEYKF